MRSGNKISPDLELEAANLGLCLRTLIMTDDRCRIDIIKSPSPGGSDAVLVGVASRWTRHLSKWSSIYMSSDDYLHPKKIVCPEALDAETAIRAVLSAYGHDLVNDIGLGKP